jgi:hypothetical protein
VLSQVHPGTCMPGGSNPRKISGKNNKITKTINFLIILHPLSFFNSQFSVQHFFKTQNKYSNKIYLFFITIKFYVSKIKNITNNLSKRK